jgi:hypothetical protein
MPTTDHHLIVQPLQKPSLEQTQVTTTHAQNSTVILHKTLDSLIEKDLVCDESRYTQQPTDLSHLNWKPAPREEL